MSMVTQKVVKAEFQSRTLIQSDALPTGLSRVYFLMLNEKIKSQDFIKLNLSLDLS